jgi:hypothetical protein
VNPYRIEGPAQISFSGGRSSGMMLCKIVQAHFGALPKDIVVAFANTGKERKETLEFVRHVGELLRVRIHWIEYRDVDGPQKDRWTEVDFATASRLGEPFAALTEKRGYLPNPVARICTQHLKIKPMEALMRSLGFKDYANVVGIRADEPSRLAKMRARQDVEFVMPLAEAGVTSAEVVAFWKIMPFDLELPTIDGETVGGNCDLCYLKGMQKIIGLIREKPESADWWIEQETRSGKMFRIDRPNYAALKVIAQRPGLFDLPDDDGRPCECID